MECRYNADGFSGWNISFEWMECGWNFRTDGISGWKEWMESMDGKFDRYRIIPMNIP